MNTNKLFVRPIRLLGVLPVVFLAALTVATFLWVQDRQFQWQEQQYVQLIENTVYSHGDHQDEESLLKQASLLLNIHPITHLSVIDENKVILHEEGLPAHLAHLKRIDLDNLRVTSFNIKDETWIALPFQSDQQPRWLLATLKHSGLQIGEYQGYLFIAIISLLSIGIALAFNQRLLNSIASPLEYIVAELRVALNSGQQKEIQVRDDSPYSSLANTINDLFAKQNNAQDEMQHNVEQYTRELRETLETVEIQNIELDIARKNALQASRAKSEFLANTSHELRTPLNGILGFTSLLLKTGLTNQQKDYLATIEQSAQGLLTVINDILDFSKLETGQLTLEYKAIFVRELIEEVFALYAPQAHEKNIRLISVVNHNVPRNLLGDPQRLKQVLTNLISNAIKFSARGNIVVRCNALGEMDNQVEIKFTITDNGIGVPDEQQEDLFSAFTKVDSSDSRFQGGTGLGLAIAKGLVDRMNGEIGVESEARIGSTFWFTVRLGVDRQRISQSPLMNSLYGVRALIYDANPTGLLETTHLLSSWGVNYIEECDFSQIRRTMQLQIDEKPDLLLLDSYPEENNFDKTSLLQGIREVNKEFKTPIILLAPPAIQRTIQDDIVGLNTIIVPRPIAHNLLHQSICNLLSIAEPLKTQDTPIASSNNIKRNSAIRVLVVDDNLANRKLVCEFLRPLGTVITSAEDGYEALKYVESQSFDLVLMDVQMPGIDGLETTKQIRAKETGDRVPIVALTAHAVAEQKTKLLLAGMDDFLSKPVSEEDLVHLIDRWVKNQDDNKRSINSAENTPPLPPSMPQSNLAVFDWADSMKLAKNKPDLAADMLNLLIKELEPTATAIREHLNNNDMDLLFDVNHKFHGGCCYCGVPAARAASKALEEQLYKKDYSNIEQLTDSLLAQIEALLLWSNEHDIDALFVDIED